MPVGEKLKAARLEAGLSQRQLCGGVITRNMLSQIENGSANPSVATLQYLAGRLGKSVSWFLEEDALQSPNLDCMQKAREAYSARQYGHVLVCLADYRGPDPLFDAEFAYLSALASLAQAELLLSQGDAAQAENLLECLNRSSIYYRQDMEQTRRRLLNRAYPMLEEAYRLQGNYERAYHYACKVRQMAK